MQLFFKTELVGDGATQIELPGEPGVGDIWR